MANSFRKYIMTDYKEVIKKMKKIGAENIHGISGEHRALNMETKEWKPYYTIHYNKRAEFEISPSVLDKLVELGVLVKE